MNAPAKILIIKLGALGDFIQALGLMRAIRRHHPGASVTLLTTAPYASLARQSGYVDDILIDERPRWHDIAGWLRLRRMLVQGGFTRVYDLQNNDRTAFYLRLFPRRPEWVGAARGASHRNASEARTAGHAFEGHIQTLALAGIEDIAPDRLDWMTSDLSGLGLPPRYVLFVPGSAAGRKEKRWPASNYAALAHALVLEGLTPVILGTADEADVIDVIAGSCPEAVNLAGRTRLEDIPALARGAMAAIGNDTGPMHLIGPTGCPSLVLFSHHSSPLRHAPRGSAVFTLQAAALDALGPQEVLETLMNDVLPGRMAAPLRN